MLVIEITDTHIKFLEGRKSLGASKVVLSEIQEISSVEESEIAALLKTRLEVIKRIKEPVVAVIPRRFTMLRVVSLPSHDNEEIAKMVPLQVVRQGPYSISDISYDFSVIEKLPNGYARVLVIVVHKDVVSRYIKMFSEAGLSIQRLTMSSLGIAAWHQKFYGEKRSGTSSVTMVVHTDVAFSEICFCQEERLLFSRSIDFGGKDLTIEQLDKFVDQINLTLSAYARENVGQDVNQIILVSSRPEITLLHEKLKEDHTCPIKIVGPQQMTETVKNKREIASLTEKGTTLIVPYGLSLLPLKKIPNLLPHEVTQTRQEQHIKKEWISFVALLIGIWLLVGVFLSIKIHKRRQYLEALEDQIGLLKGRVDDVQEKISRLREIKKMKENYIKGIDIIKEIYNITPSAISYNQLQILSGEKIILKGLSPEGGLVNDLQRALVASPFFSNVTLQYATKRRIYNGEVVDFKIICYLAGKGLLPEN